MRKTAYLAALLIAILVGLWVRGQFVADKAVRPAKEAVLAMVTDLDAKPVMGTQRIAPPEEAPNIVLIVADDLGWRDVGYNFSEIRTPTIDRLAATGITLNRFYVQPSCSPTRAALMTGKSPMRLGILNPLSKNNPTGLPLEETTLANALGSAGYQTALTGKWHLGARNRAYHPNNRGFDHFYGNLTGGVGYFDKVHGGGYDWQRNGKTVRDDHYATRLIANEAIDVIEARDTEKPLFLYVAFGAPHMPNEAPDATIAQYKDIKNENRRIHAAMVTEMDTAIERIHRALVAEGMEDNTLIWFMSDNGGLFPSHPARHLPDAVLGWAAERQLEVELTPRSLEFMTTNLRNGGSDNRPFQGGKGSVQEGGVRVPSFIHWPAQFEPKSYNYMATVQDVAPTLMQITNASPGGASFDGRSLWRALKSNTSAPVMDYVVVARAISNANAIYRYPYKLIEEDGAQRLFDLEADPLELQDIAKREAEIVQQLSRALAAFPRGENIALSAQEIVQDTDFFGGQEDREPWAERAYDPAPPD